MKLPTVGHCCWCIDLLTAGKIIGWLKIVFGVCLLFFSVFAPPLIIKASKIIASFSYITKGNFKPHELFFPIFLVLFIIISIRWLNGIENVSTFLEQQFYSKLFKILVYKTNIFNTWGINTVHR